MLHRFLLPAVLVLFAGVACADVINVTVSASLSASGSVAAVCAPVTPGCVPGSGGAPPLLTVPFSFSASTNQLGDFSQSWNATNPIGGSVQPYAEENSTVCSVQVSGNCQPGTGDALNLHLIGGHSALAVAFSAMETENVLMSFDLTDQSLATIYTGFFQGNNSSETAEILDSTGTNILLLAPANQNASVLLNPGAYELDVSLSGGLSGASFSQSNVIDSQMYLTAQFTPVAVPEPRGLMALAILVALFARYLFFSLRRLT